MAHTAAAITAVASQPKNLSRGLDTNFPMTLGLPASSIITMRTGTEITPLMTALQKSALMGSIGLKLSAIPPSVANATMALEMAQILLPRVAHVGSRLAQAVGQKA